MGSLKTTATVTSAWLRRQLTAGHPNLAVLDTTWPALTPGFQSKHIPSARIFDQDQCCDPPPVVAPTLPEPECFSRYARKLGLNAHSHVILYDRGGKTSAARAWWTFRVLGHRRVSVLNGGIQAWEREGNPTKSGDPRKVEEEGSFVSNVQRDLVRSYSDMIEIVNNGNEQIVDARHPRHFNGLEPEPSSTLVSAFRAARVAVPEHIQKGHVPGAINLPAGHVLAHNGMLRSPTELAAIFRQAGIDLDRHLTVMCYNGHTACLVALAATICGNSKPAVYYGSWVEWGQKAGPDYVVSEEGNKRAVTL